MGAETTFKRRVKKDLKTLKRQWHYKANDLSTKGILDIILCINGKFIALELKDEDAPKKCHEVLQAAHIMQIRQAGGEAYFVDQSSWPALFEYLSTL